MRIGEHDSHPAADTFPLMDSAAIAGLAEDIAANGLRRPITMIGDLILDGRNRYLACIQAKVKPRFRVYDGPDSPADLARYVISENLARRDLDPGQRALCSRRLVKWATGDRKKNKKQEWLPSVAEADDSAADALMADGTPELVAAVDRGEIPLSAAAALSKCEPEEQRAAVERIAKADAAPVRRSKSEHVSLTTCALELSPVDVASLKALAFLGEKSVHAEARAGAALLRRMAPVLGRAEK